VDNKVSQSTHGGSVDRGNLTTAPDVFVVVQIDKFPADVFSQMLLSRRAGGRLFHTAGTYTGFAVRLTSVLLAGGYWIQSVQTTVENDLRRFSPTRRDPMEAK